VVHSFQHRHIKNRDHPAHIPWAIDAPRIGLPESKFSLYFIPWDARFVCVPFDRGIQIAQILQVFHPPAEAFELRMKLADGGTVRLALFGSSIHLLLFDFTRMTRGNWCMWTPNKLASSLSIHGWRMSPSYAGRFGAQIYTNGPGRLAEELRDKVSSGAPHPWVFGGSARWLVCGTSGFRSYCAVAREEVPDGGG
jgi:hypothetical protein